MTPFGAARAKTYLNSKHQQQKMDSIQFKTLNPAKIKYMLAQ